METNRRHLSRRLAQMAVVGLWMLGFPASAFGRDTISGRLYVTYQNSQNSGVRQEYLTERFETTLRDRVFERNDFALTFYFDNATNLTRDQTFRRYRWLLNLQNNYYTFNVRYSPRQKITPLELHPSQESGDNQVLFDLHIPDLPRLRLSYANKDRFFEGTQTGENTDLRGELTYTYKIFYVGLNRYRSESENSAQRTTTVTGADLRAARSFGPAFGFNAGYQYQLNEFRRTPGTPSDVTNHTLAGVFTSQYRRTLLGTLSLSHRELLIDNNTGEGKSTDDNDMISALFLPFSPVNLELSQTFLRSEQDTSLTQSDYGTVQLLADGNFWRTTHGRLQIARRFDINTINGVIPDHIYYLTVRSTLYPGIDLRADANVSERVEDTARTSRFQTVSLLDLYIWPWNNLSLMPHIQHIRFSDDVGFTGNDRATYGLTLNYHARSSATFGMDLSRNLVTTGFQSVSNSANFNLGLSLRKRSSLTMSYGINEIDQFATSLRPEVYDKTKTFNVTGQVWLMPRGSLALNYTDVRRENQDDSSFFTASYRQDF